MDARQGRRHQACHRVGSPATASETPPAPGPANPQPTALECGYDQGQSRVISNPQATDLPSTGRTRSCNTRGTACHSSLEKLVQRPDPTASTSTQHIQATTAGPPVHACTCAAARGTKQRQSCSANSEPLRTARPAMKPPAPPRRGPPLSRPSQGLGNYSFTYEFLRPCYTATDTSILCPYQGPTRPDMCRALRARTPLLLRYRGAPCHVDT